MYFRANKLTDQKQNSFATAQQQHLFKHMHLMNFYKQSSPTPKLMMNESMLLILVIFSSFWLSSFFFSDKYQNKTPSSNDSSSGEWMYSRKHSLWSLFWPFTHYLRVSSLFLPLFHFRSFFDLISIFWFFIGEIHSILLNTSSQCNNFEKKESLLTSPTPLSFSPKNLMNKLPGFVFVCDRGKLMNVENETYCYLFTFFFNRIIHCQQGILWFDFRVLGSIWQEVIKF